MGNVGNQDNLIINGNWILKQGSDKYILKNKVSLNLARGRFNDAIEIGPVNSFGVGDHTVPVEFEADITKTVNWANLNARDENGKLVNLPYTLEMASAPFVGIGASATGTATQSDGEVTSIAVNDQGTNYTSVLITFDGGNPTISAKAIGIVSEGKVIKIIVIEKGSEYTSTPIISITEVSSPVAFGLMQNLGM